jgi:two-component system sensor histidine kinase KdpD
MRTRGVLALAPADPQLIALPEQYRLLETFAAQIALALERVHYVEVAQDALVSMESERLRNALLSTLSHDLRTPLTAIVGLSSAVLNQLADAPAAQCELAHDLQEEAHRMSSMVSNLLDMARLQSGRVPLNREWQTLEEVVGSAVPVPYHGSGHLIALSRADGMLEIPLGVEEIAAGEPVTVHLRF